MTKVEGGSMDLSIEKSRSLLEESDKVLIWGCQGHKRSHAMLDLGYPVFTSRAKGARFWDADGNEYLDYLMAFGPILLGYDDETVNAAIIGQLGRGTVFSTAHELEIHTARRILSLHQWAGMVGFFIGGSATTTGAVRIARAFNGKSRIVRCGYHGWHDWTQAGGSGVPPEVGALTKEFEYGSLDSLEKVLEENKDQVACVIVETVHGQGPPAGFLQGCVDLAHRYEAVCIFDEIKVGFRIAMGGATEYYGVTPDLATFGKACCNGYPGGFVVGKKQFLETQSCQEAWLAATFHCDLLSLTAMNTVFDEMSRRDGIAYQKKLGSRLVEGVNAACKRAGLSYTLQGHPAMPAPNITDDDRPRCISMLQGVLRRGFYLHPDHPMFLCLSHTEDDIERTIEAVEESLREL